MFLFLCELPPAHRQSGKAQGPAAAAGGCKASPGSGAAEGVRGAPRQRERICNYTLNRHSYMYRIQALCLVQLFSSCWVILPFLSSPQLLKEAVESQRMCELMKQQEVHLKQQVSHFSLLCTFYNAAVIHSTMKMLSQQMPFIWSNLCCCPAVTVHREVWRVSDHFVQEQRGLHYVQTGDGKGDVSV